MSALSWLWWLCGNWRSLFRIRHPELPAVGMVPCWDCDIWHQAGQHMEGL